MTRGVSAKLNAVLSRWLPEQRLFAKTDDRTRFLRLSPVAQLAGGACLAALIGWTGYLTAAQLSNAELGARVTGAEQRLIDIYEMRIARLEGERRQLAERLSESRVGMAFAAEEAAETHASLGQALAEVARLSATAASHRSQLAELAAAQAAAQSRSDALDAQLAAATADHAIAADRLAASDAALADLAAALDRTAVERDSARGDANALLTEVATLQAAFDLRRDQQMRLMARLEDAARLSLGSLETVFSKTGVDLDTVLAEVRRDYSGSGGLFIPLDEGAGFDGAGLQGAEDAAATERVTALMADMERINSMRIAVDHLPVSRPVGAARLSSVFGPRKDPINGRNSFHAGMDFAAPRGAAIFAAGAGEVVYSGRQRGYGQLIKIRHAFGYETVYAHLNRRRVKVGDKVERGDRIGDMGNTGRSTGTHLHYEIRVNGKTVNPAKYIEAARNVL